MKRSFELGGVVTLSAALGAAGALAIKHFESGTSAKSKKIQEQTLGQAADSIGQIALDALKDNRAKIVVNNDGDFGEGVASIRIVTRGLHPEDSVADDNTLSVGIGRDNHGNLDAKKTVGVEIDYYDPTNRDLSGSPAFEYEFLMDPSENQSDSWVSTAQLELSGRGSEAFLEAGGNDTTNSYVLAQEAEDLASKVLQGQVIADK